MEHRWLSLTPAIRSLSSSVVSHEPAALTDRRRSRHRLGDDSRHASFIHTTRRRNSTRPDTDGRVGSSHSSCPMEAMKATFANRMLMGCGTVRCDSTWWTVSSNSATTILKLFLCIRFSRSFGEALVPILTDYLGRPSSSRDTSQEPVADGLP
jgi:hypothetical protein